MRLTIDKDHQKDRRQDDADDKAKQKIVATFLSADVAFGVDIEFIVFRHN
jgi:hypothetical protein